MKKYLGGLALYFAGAIIFSQGEIALLLALIGWALIFTD